MAAHGTTMQINARSETLIMAHADTNPWSGMYLNALISPALLQSPRLPGHWPPNRILAQVRGNSRACSVLIREKTILAQLESARIPA